MLQDLTITNKLLKVDWDERSSVLLTMVRDIAQIRSGVFISLPPTVAHTLHIFQTLQLHPYHAQLAVNSLCQSCTNCHLR
jgi:hypothetical protein